MSTHNYLTTFDQSHPKIIKATFSFPEFVSKNRESVCSVTSFLKYSQFQSFVTRVASPIFDHAHLNIFQSTFNFQESVSTYKRKQFPSLCSRAIADLKSLHSPWPRAFWSIFQETDFSQKWDLYKNTANISFCYRPNSEKIND